MKFLHTADLHIGKKLFETSLIEDQRYILRQILEIAKKEQVDAVLIAGDVYDRAVPSAEAVTLLDDFLTKLLEQKTAVLVISGNHDSPERLAFAERILEKQGLYIAGTYGDEVKRVILGDMHGPVEFVLLPFVKPAAAGCVSGAQAAEKLLGSIKEEKSFRRVLLAHCFAVGEQGEAPELSASESDVNVGGLDAVPVSLFRDFSYVALGHIHKPQKIGEIPVYYSGSPLKYSFSEAAADKSVQLVELDGQGRVSVKRHILKPLHEMRCIKGKLAELIGGETIHALQKEGIGTEDYLQVTLTDTEELIDPMAALRSVYPNTLFLLLQKNIKREGMEYESRISRKKKTTAELFADFYEMLKGEALDEKRKSLVEAAAEAAENPTEI